MFHVEHQVSRLDLPFEIAGNTRKNFSKKRATLEDYIDRLLWWNKKINLVSRDVSRETILRHVEHSLVISGSGLLKEAEEIIDSGTGGGLPGIPLAIVWPEKRVLLNDVVSKKVMACKHISAGLKLNNIDAVADSVKNIEINKGAVIVSKHAFKINDLLEMIREKPWKNIVLLKGGDEVEQELSGINEKLIIKIIDLEPGFEHPFYQGKAMVEITKQGTE
ncbi:MAG: class I SAM-dependent methyltransferase [Gracilimonas sp.]|uniref:16S rRNA (guanine(527)-N(7))-methyltransferase RsmG n=1 Tax=Gracilimonas sp. TaxID=1974203 RepID=UPI0019A19BB5|nr:RsmG family class I SAM-dependent methyltransferase [Gracilimonas sp.]MBD3617169.1 class I SAM-dependent methyltransferase [Gracilimonas sp.]